jgi:curved DNA-binding protein CbpA
MKDCSTMDFEKDYYADLGVLPDVSKEVIRAVYLALAKRFHPDSGGEHADQDKLKTINAAYEILYDKNSRKKYDEGRTDHQQSSYNRDVDDEEDLFDDELVDDWEFAVEYYPELEELRKEVSAISSTLSVVFQRTILGTKNFKAASQVKSQVVENFIERYFGTDAVVKRFAVLLLKTGRRDVAKELNRAVLVFGSELDPKTVIPKIRFKFDIPDEDKSEIYYKGYRILINDRYLYDIFEQSTLISGRKSFISPETAKSFIDHLEG